MVAQEALVVLLGDEVSIPPLRVVLGVEVDPEVLARLGDLHD